MTPMFSAYVVTPVPPRSPAMIVATPSPMNARPRYGVRFRPVSALTALTCPVFSATRTIATGAISAMAPPLNSGSRNAGMPNQEAAPTGARSTPWTVTPRNCRPSGDVPPKSKVARYPITLPMRIGNRLKTPVVRSPMTKIARTVIAAITGSAAERLRGRRQVEPNDSDYRSGDQRRHEVVNPARASQMDDQANKGVDDTGRDDAAEGQSDAVDRAARRGGSGHRRHRPDKGEARAEVAWHRAADEGKEDQGADAGEEDGQIRIEPHQDRRDDRGSEHGEDM